MTVLQPQSLEKTQAEFCSSSSVLVAAQQQHVAEQDSGGPAIALPLHGVEQDGPPGPRHGIVVDARRHS